MPRLRITQEDLRRLVEALSYAIQEAPKDEAAEYGPLRERLKENLKSQSKSQ